MVALLANPIKDWGISVLQFDYFLDRFFSFFQFLRQKLRFFKVSWGGEGKPTRRVPLGTEHCQSFFIDATSKLVTKLQATCD